MWFIREILHIIALAKPFNQIYFSNPMKKFIFAALVAVFAFGTANAQKPTPEEVQASVQRYHKLQSMKKPDRTSLSNIDALATKAEAAAQNSVEVSMLLERAAGTSPEANADIALTNDEYVALTERVNKEQKDLQELTNMMTPAANDLKTASALNKVKATKSIGYSKDVISILTAEAAYHTKTMSSIVTGK